MNAIIAIALLGTGILAAAGVAILTLVITAIHSEERRVSLSEQPSTYAETLARKIMNVHVSQPDARRILTARRAGIARKATARRTAARTGTRHPRPNPGRRHATPAHRKSDSALVAQAEQLDPGNCSRSDPWEQDGSGGRPSGALRRGYRHI